MLGEFVKDFGILGSGFENRLQSECGELRHVCGQRRFAQCLVELGVVWLGLKALLQSIDRLQGVFFDLRLDFHRAERGG